MGDVYSLLGSKPGMISWRISSSKDFSVGMRSEFAELETAENVFWDIPFWEFRRKINVAMSLFMGTAVKDLRLDLVLFLIELFHKFRRPVLLMPDTI